jgi:hypothetical protein
MSIQSEINRITTAKNDIATAIANKGVAVPSGTKIDGMAGLIAGIQTGADTSNDTVTEEVLLYGYTAHDSAGNAITGIAGARVEGEVLLHRGTVTGETLEWGEYQWPILVVSL